MGGGGAKWVWRKEIGALGPGPTEGPADIGSPLVVPRGAVAIKICWKLSS